MKTLICSKCKKFIIFVLMLTSFCSVYSCSAVAINTKGTVKQKVESSTEININDQKNGTNIKHNKKNKYFEGTIQNDLVEGSYCYTYGDRESVANAKQFTKDMAIKNAIESYCSVITSQTVIKNSIMLEDLAKSKSAGLLKNIQIVDQYEEDRTLCYTVKATIVVEELSNILNSIN